MRFTPREEPTPAAVASSWRTCGASLFWDPLDTRMHDWLGIAMGAFEGPTNTTVKMHIFIEEKGDSYEITDGLPQHER
ncbi:GFA family protein [Myxococcus sp. AB056]|uniref:GFA family protein n=1 Tax=Myxococcus sp. AB056 TaxID=2562792 RepID=UPI0011478F78|nr:hypothetical protein [Myxococcus sp. AB056]